MMGQVVAAAMRSQRLEAPRVGQTEVGKHEVEGPRAVQRLRSASFSVSARSASVGRFRKGSPRNQVHQRGEVRVVLDQQDAHCADPLAWVELGHPSLR